MVAHHDDVIEREGAVDDVALVEEGHDLGHLVSDLESAVQRHHAALASSHVLQQRQRHHALPKRPLVVSMHTHDTIKLDLD
jgi:hypothetical protein